MGRVLVAVWCCMSAASSSLRNAVALYLQGSLEGTQAAADELLEEAALGFMNPRQDEDHEERAFGGLVLYISQGTLQEVAAILGFNYNAWSSSTTVRQAHHQFALCFFVLKLHFYKSPTFIQCD